MDKSSSNLIIFDRIAHHKIFFKKKCGIHLNTILPVADDKNVRSQIIKTVNCGQLMNSLGLNTALNMFVYIF